MLRDLPALNSNYPDDPQPWRCVTHEAHECSGEVVGALGAVPVCQAGAVAEQAAQDRQRARIDALMADPGFQRQLAEEAAMERRLEGRW